MLKHTRPIIIDSTAGDMLSSPSSQSPISGMAAAEVRRAIILTYPGCFLGEAIELMELMTALNSDHVIHYVTRIYSLAGGRVDSPSSKLIHVDSLAVYGPVPIENDLLIIASGARSSGDPTGEISRWLQAVCPASKQIVALGSGVLQLAVAGLLDHRRVTIHSALAPFLTANFPLVEVKAVGALRVDGNLFTTNEHIDLRKLALLLVKDPPSLKRVQRPAKPVRQAGAAIVFHSAAFVSKGAIAHRILLWWLIHLDYDITMQSSADFLAMSERSFRRHFKSEVGYNPNLFLLLLRLELARQALLDSDLPIDKIARRGGLHDGQQLARMFRKFLGISPNQYRVVKGLGDLPQKDPLYGAVFDGRRTPCWLLKILGH
ncbi:helix-turn-helix domain-containing protein [Sodalis sp. dw_96]|uniref:helix-turn-helix domain-containing protein n=1 Tax=Sodalis sp. dw_96 TaxID=2719794 RepID=UPI001BD5A14F|nr:helix-turn-helix domain-containing protein [Sodalis sp. dw_96]